ncbi:hypothetical protein JRA98_003296 [Escherichia coli O28ac]|uniref:PheA operon leader peptide PheL n=2 Tax=Enterobacteriaceae TaxID=543 RepID=J7R4C6_ECOLX|nr:MULTISPECIES: pheA operon leader peptide PheL [Enterobacteriaceae]EEY7939021.1 hypothetical protein [Escherichia coli O20:H9]EEZ5742396.1 hypothetical protein [Escherichia coli O9]EEZ5747003.1 hypothetical protein [Escherichia coli O25]EEZ5888610.1 hypothetical protein [Escherichia coli O146]EEZ5988834.1 hypothetical protein [Escherichia coli O78]EEZ8703097.1 hypothetical protein [Escherichia coli O91]EEZ9864161.1 hypothetical protein [Escherichia coli O8]EFA8662412.1 hypothetical protei
MKHTPFFFAFFFIFP